MQQKDDDPDNFIDDLTDKVKSGLNSTFHIILNSLSFPLWQAALMLTLEFIQSLYFVFYPPAGFEWNFEGAESAVVVLIKVSLIWPYLAEKSTAIYFFVFYLSGFLLALALGLFLMFITVKGKKKSLIRATVLHILGVFIHLLQTVLYLPLLSISYTLITRIAMYALVVSCSGDKNVVITDYECWTTEHYAHTVFGFIFSGILLLLVIPTSAIFFENNCSSSNAFKKVSATADVMWMSFKALLTVALILFNNPDNSVSVTYLCICFSLLMWYSFYSMPRFFDSSMSKLWILYVELFFLASVCNLLGNFLSNYDFGGSLILFFLQGLLLMVYNFFLSSGSEVILTKPMNQIINFKDYEMYMKELCSILANKRTISPALFLDIDREAELIIRGYVGEHSRLCPCINECPLGIALRSNPSIVSTIDKTQHVYKSMPLLVAHAEKMYEYYIENYAAREAGPRISFARFIVNFSKEPTLAIKYLTHARGTKRSIQEQFFIYRYERLLEESYKNRISLDDSGNVNVLNVMKYEKYQKEFNDLLEQNGLLHMQFWSTLLDESPSMAKVCDVGFKILNIDYYIEKYWKKIQLIYPNNPKDLIAYSTYLYQVWNDKESASQISERAKDSAYSNKYATIFTTHMQDISNFSTDGSSCVFMSGDKRTLGKIKNCNLAFCKLFGYFKKEIIGSDIKSLMPELIAEHHDKFIQRNLDKIKISCCSVASQDLFSIGMHKNRYIFPLSIKILSTPNLLNDMQYIAKLKIDKKLITGTTCYLLLNKRGHVMAISSSCVNILHISTNTLSNYIVDMNVMAPSLFSKELPYNCFHKSGSLIKVYHPRADQLKMEDNLFKEDIEVMKRGDEVSEFHCYLSELNYEPVGHIGYLVRLDAKLEEVNLSCLHFSKKAPRFQFQYLEDRNRFTRDIIDDEASCTSYFGGTPRSPVLSSLSRGGTISRTSFNTSSKRDLSQLNAHNLKMLSQRSKTPSAEHHELVLRRAARSVFGEDLQSKGVVKGVPVVEPPSKEETPTSQLKKQNTFISALNDNGSKLNRSKSRHASYYDALLPKYKHLSKFANDDYGTFNLVRIIEQQVLYGEGIKTLRLVNGEIEEVTEENYSQLLFREIETPEIGITEGRRNIAKHKEEEYRLLKSRLKTKKDLRKLIDDTPYPLSLTIIKAFTLVCIILLTTLLIAEYVYTRYRLKGILEATEMLDDSFQLKESMLNLWYNARELFLVVGGTYSAYTVTHSNSTTYMSSLQNLMNSQSFKAHTLINSLSAYPSDIPQADVDYILGSMTPIFLYTSSTNQLEYTTKKYSIFQAIQIEIESFVKISKLESEEFKKSEYLLHTAVDSLYSSLLDASNILVRIFFGLLESLSIRSDVIDYMILSLSAFDLLLCLAADIIFIKFISRYQTRVMHIFLEIPRKYALYLNSQCETYIAELQNSEKGNEAENPSEEDEKEGEYDQTVSLKYDHAGYQRIYTHKKSIGNNYLISFILLMLATEAYFIWQFIMRSNFYDNLIEFSKIFRTANEEHVVYMEVIDIYREYYNNPQTTYGRIVPLPRVVNTYWNTLYELGKAYKANDPTSSSLLSETAKDQIQSIFSGNLCLQNAYKEILKPGEQCENIANKTLTLGLNSVKAYTLNSLKTLIYKNKSSNRNHINDPTLWDIKQIYDNFIQVADTQIIRMLSKSLNDAYDRQLNNRIIYLIVFTVCLNFLFAVLCYPLLMAIRGFVMASRQMLSIIPVDCIIMSRTFEKLVLKHLKK